MYCMYCRFQNGCDGAVCYYEHIQEQREAEPDYNEAKYYMVDECRRCAYTDKVFSKRDIDEYDRENPENDTYSFMTKDEVEADGSIRWDTDDSWMEDGKQEAVEIIGRHGIAEVFSWWKDFDATQFVLKLEIGFYNEIMRQAEEAGLKR